MVAEGVMVLPFMNNSFRQEPLFPSPYNEAENLFEKVEDVGVIFNTAFVRSRALSPGRDLTGELAEISKTPAYQAIMQAALQLAQTQNISELEAAEQIITTFRKMDDVWKNYVLQEGMARITGE
jgi:hypothetical protein